MHRLLPLKDIAWRNLRSTVNPSHLRSSFVCSPGGGGSGREAGACSCWRITTSGYSSFNSIRTTGMLLQPPRSHVPASTDRCATSQGSVLGNPSVQLPVWPCGSGCLYGARLQSTTPTNAEPVPTKKKKRYRRPRFSQYVDLLEVTELAANEKKSRVKRLNAKNLQDFITRAQQRIVVKRSKEEKVGDANSAEMAAPSPPQPPQYQKMDIDILDSSVLQAAAAYDDKPLIFFGKKKLSVQMMNSPDQVGNVLKSFHDFRNVIETLAHEESEVGTEFEAYNLTAPALGSAAEEIIDPLESAEPYISPDILLDVARPPPAVRAELSKSSADSRKKSIFKSKQRIDGEHERLAKERALRINLNTYLSVCVATGQLNRGMSTIMAYRHRARTSTVLNSSLITIELYNILLHGFAEKGSFDRFRDIFSLIEGDGLQFNEQTFAAVFECLGRVESSEENTQLIADHIQKAAQLGFTLNDIMDRAKFLYDQRDIALDAIQRVQPHFQPVYTPPQLGYSNPLLNRLNEHILPMAAAATSGSGCECPDGASASSRGYTQVRLQEMAREQLKVELDGHITIKSIEKSKEFANAEYCRKKLKELETLWHSQICAAVRRDLNTLRAQVRFRPHGYMAYYTYLRTLDAAQYADILLKEIYKLAEGSETFSPTVGQLYRELGQKVQQRYQVEMKKRNGVLDKIGDIYSSYCTQWDEQQQQRAEATHTAGTPADGVAWSSDNTRQMWQRLVHAERSSGPSMDVEEPVWPPNVLTGVGRFLYNILMRDIKIDTHIMRQNAKAKQQNLLPAFYTLFRNQCRIVKEEVKPHPVMARLLRASRQQTLTFASNLVPMLCPPQPWSTPHNGGYLLNKSELIRLPHQAVQQWDRIHAAEACSLYPALDSLNQLASIPWRVNTDVLDVIVEVFQSGGNEKLDVPQPPSSLPPLPTIHERDATMSSAERAKQFKEKLGHRRKQAEMYSLWCDTLYRLSLANHYRDKVFWLPHNMDFRGRVYPVPPHLNHLGSDLARSMLVFDQARPLGVDGFSWLKLHCVNLTGLKKRDSVHERLLYAEQIMDDILDSADRPLTGRKWWARSDEPWQTLACCIEIAKVQRSPNTAEYLSRFPVHQDGSCNGLQHYAALGRDQAGAFSVNLVPSEQPQDVYSAVAALVEKARGADAQNGLHVAGVLDGFVRRKVIKQTVMTTVYGVTRYGARLQIARQLKDIDEFPREWVWPASTYLTTKTFESLREMFTSTREIQDWFTECARLIAGICGRNVEWVTPLGLPVVQPYSKQEMRQTPRSAGTRIAESMPMDAYDRPNILKQKNAFPPNFIHSLDSSHMMLTSLNCERSGMTFVSVHDCFWTHACTVPQMNSICREQFVALHAQPILEDLSRFMTAHYSFKESDFSNDGSAGDLSKRHLNRVLRKLPPKSDFNLDEVLDSVYFFS